MSGFVAVTGRIHSNDGLLDPDDSQGEYYARCGKSAVQNIESALAAAGRTFSDVESCLDLGCGYGRVVRLLAERIEPARITACDVNTEAVAFCAHEFGVRPLPSDPEFKGVPFETYDLIWVGSLVTHLDRRLASSFSALLPRILSPGGLLVITTHGDFAIANVSRYESWFAEHQVELEHAYREHGFAFVPYEGTTGGLGYAWHSSEYLRELVEAPFGGELEHQGSLARGWVDHQDVHVFRRA